MESNGRGRFLAFFGAMAWMLNGIVDLQAEIARLDEETAGQAEDIAEIKASQTRLKERVHGLETKVGSLAVDIAEIEELLANRR